MSVAEDPAGSQAVNLGEMLYPVFNSLVPQLVESLPFVWKVKDSDVQNNIL
jgi:hypothetical protein